MTKNNVGVIIGRFQTPSLHAAHIDLINKVINECDRVIIFVGTSVVKDSNRNPLDFRTREIMIQSHIRCSNLGINKVIVAPLADQPNDTLWSKELDRRIREIDSMGNVMLYGGRDSFIPHYSGQFSITEVDYIAAKSATELRQEIANCPRATSDFRSGVIYAKMNQYPKIHSTVDVLVYDQSRNKMLLGKKPNETSWRLIGGFVDPTDLSLEAAAKREVKEEAQIEVYNVTYVCSQLVNDWRYAKEQNKIMTTLFSALYKVGEAKASDDLEVVEWFNVTDVRSEVIEINPAHKSLIHYA